jgi:mannose-6-phosphate isomerase-like protein (cupin superfamily)
VSEFFGLDQLLAERVQSQHSYLEFLRVPAMSAGVYVLPARTRDPQKPHSEDEIYYVVRGKAKIGIGADNRSIGEGSLIFVEAGQEHHFFDIQQELVVLVVFAPAESS